MRAVVLVGGFGTRLRPLTLAVPKQMLPVGHVTMLEQVVARLGAAGVTEVVLSLGYRPDVFLEAFPDGTCAGVALRYAEEPEPLDTAGAIAFAAREAGINETFLAVNGDVLTDLDVTALWERHHRAGGSATIALTPVEDPTRYGVVATDGDDRVQAFVEKPAPGTAPSNLINAGAYVLEPAVIDRIPPGEPRSIERCTFPELVGEGSLFAVSSDAYWLDAGTPATYLQANLDLIDGIADGGADGLSLEALVSSSASVRRSVVGAGAQVGPGAELSGSVIIPCAVVAAGARVDGSIVGGRSVFGEGAKLTECSVVGFDQKVEPSAVHRGTLVPPPEQWQ
jgi:mannose-1-phosphate guanylyltransferase